MRAERLDDDLLGVLDGVDDQAEALPIGLQDDDVDRLVGALDRSAELPGEVDDRQQPTAQPVDGSAVDQLDAGAGVLSLEPQQLDEAQLRDREAAVAAADHQRRDDGQGERDLDLDTGPGAQLALHVDGPADALDVGADHVHPDTAAGDVGDLSGGRDARSEDQVDRLTVAHRCRLVCGDQPVGDRLVADPGRIDAPAVVRDLDVDLTALVEGPQRQESLLGLARRASVLRTLDSVVDRVTHQVRERILDGLDDGLVELGVLALHHQLHLLAAGQGQVTHDPWQLVPDVADRLHPGLHDPFLQLGGDQVEALGRAGEAGVLLLGDQLDDLVAGQHELADQVHQLVEQADVHTDRGVSDAAAVLLGLDGLVHRVRGGLALIDEDLAELARVTELLLARSQLDRLGGGEPVRDEQLTDARHQRRLLGIVVGVVVSHRRLGCGRRGVRSVVPLKRRLNDLLTVSETVEADELGFELADVLVALLAGGLDDAEHAA